jgi:hypothetical protein
MIGRVHPPRMKFNGIVSYMETGSGGRQKPCDRVAWVEFRKLPTRSPRTAANMMDATANASVSGTTTPVYHFSISCDPGDPVGPDTLRRVADRTVRDLGLEEYEVLIFAHKDRSHPHLHFVVNRVHPERYTLWRPWRDYVRIERSLRAQEVELGLRVVPGKLAPIPSKSIDGPEQEGAGTHLRPQARIGRGDAAFIAAVTERAVPVLERSQSWAELQGGLAEHGLAVRVKGGGITVTDGRQEVKASDVGRQFSRRNLEKRFGSYPDYGAQMAVASATAPVGRTVLPTREQPQAPSAGTISSPAPELAASASEPLAPVPAPQPRIPAGRRPQFGDAGHGVSELFGRGTGPAIERAPTPPQEQPFREMTPAAEPYVQQRQAPILRAEPGAPRLPSSATADHPPLDPLHVAPGRPRQQFGDAGHGIAELFGYGEVPAPERPVPAPEQADPAAERASARPQQPEWRDTAFLLDVQKRAALVLRRAKSWAELERGLSEQGLSLRMTGGGFRVTDGIQQVKASDVGRAFSRFHLEKRLGPYPIPTPIMEPEARAPQAEVAALPQAPATLPEQLALPLPAPASQEAPPPRFTLYEQDGAFRVYDTVDPHIHFAETRERAVAEVNWANKIAAAYPDVSSMRYLRELNGARRDARRLPRLPEPDGRRITVPTPEDDGPPSSPPVARVQREEPTPAAAPPEPATALLAERAPAAPPVSESPVQPEPSPPAETPTRTPVRRSKPSAPVRKTLVPRTDREDAPVQQTAPAPPVPALPHGSLARDPGGPELPREIDAYLRVLTEAAEALDLLDQHKKAGAEFEAAGDELAGLPERRKRADAAVEGYRSELREVYADPATAEKAIAEHRKQHGTDATAGAIELSPERFGALRPDPHQGMFSRLWRRDTHGARSEARVLVHHFRHAFIQLAARPTAQDEERGAVPQRGCTAHL